MPDWGDLRAVLAFKTFYIALVLLLGSLGLFGVWVGANEKSSAAAQATLALAIALATSSTLSLISELVLRLDIVRLVNDQLLQTLSSRDDSTVVEFHETRRQLDCVEVASRASGTLRIVGISANDILAVQPLDVIRRRVQLGEIQVQILLLNPGSHFGAERSIQSAYGSPHSMATRIEAVVSHLGDLASDLSSAGVRSGTVEGRYLDRSPMVSAILDEAQAIVTPLVSQLTGGRSPYFVVSASGPQTYLYLTYKSHFDELWQDGVQFL